MPGCLSAADSTRRDTPRTASRNHNSWREGGASSDFPGTVRLSALKLSRRRRVPQRGTSRKLRYAPVAGIFSGATFTQPLFARSPVGTGESEGERGSQVSRGLFTSRYRSSSTNNYTRERHLRIICMHRMHVRGNSSFERLCD